MVKHKLWVDEGYELPEYHECAMLSSIVRLDISTEHFDASDLGQMNASMPYSP
jgi:hypothetical protein